MGLFDRLLMNQVVKALSATEYAAQLRRLPSEYEQGTEMLRLKVHKRVYLDLFPRNAAWQFGLAKITNGKTNRPSERGTWPCGVALNTTAKQIAANYVAQVPDVKKRVAKSFAKSGTGEKAASASPRSSSPRRPTPTPAPTRKKESESSIDPEVSLMIQCATNLSEVFDELGGHITFYWSDDPVCVRVLAAGMPEFCVGLHDARWTIVWSADGSDWLRSKDCRRYDTHLSVTGDLAFLGLAICELVVMVMFPYYLAQGWFEHEANSLGGQASVINALKFSVNESTGTTPEIEREARAAYHRMRQVVDSSMG